MWPAFARGNLLLRFDTWTFLPRNMDSMVHHQDSLVIISISYLQEIRSYCDVVSQLLACFGTWICSQAVYYA